MNVDLDELETLLQCIKPLRTRAAYLGYEVVLRNTNEVTASPPRQKTIKEPPFTNPTEAIDWAIPQMDGAFTVREMMNFIAASDPSVVVNFDYSSYGKALKRRARLGGPLKLTDANGQNIFQRL